jgi:MGT family glycosyltransferase
VFGALITRLWKTGLPYINDARQSRGLRPATGIFDQADDLAAVYVLTTRAFDFEAKVLPPNVRYVGPQLDDPNWAEPWTPPWPPGDTRPLVLVSLSSTFQNQAGVLRNCLAALASLPVRALVTLGPALDPADFPTPGPHVSVVRSAPHTRVLAQASAMVTHCGHGTVMKSLAAGVPIVGIPMGRDQNDTAARIVYRNAGVRLKPSDRAATIANAIMHVLETPALRDGARRQADAIRRELAAVDLPAEIERLAAAPAPALAAAR